MLVGSTNYLQDILNDPETMAFTGELSKLCWQIVNSDQVVTKKGFPNLIKVMVTAVVDHDGEEEGDVSLSFEQFDVVLPKKRFISFGLAVAQERSYFVFYHFLMTASVFVFTATCNKSNTPGAPTITTWGTFWSAASLTR